MNSNNFTELPDPFRAKPGMEFAGLIRQTRNPYVTGVMNLPFHPFRFEDLIGLIPGYFDWRITLGNCSMRCSPKRDGVCTPSQRFWRSGTLGIAPTSPDEVFAPSAPFYTGKCGGVYETSIHKAEPFTDSAIWNRKNGGFDLYLAVNVTITNMKYLLTDHAKKRIAKRQISSEWIEDTLAYPARIESDRDDPTLIHALRPITERGFRVLRVIFNETVKPVAIVAAYFDDEVKDL